MEKIFCVLAIRLKSQQVKGDITAQLHGSHDRKGLGIRNRASWSITEIWNCVFLVFATIVTY